MRTRIEEPHQWSEGVVQRPVLGPLRRGRIVVSVTEDALLPQPAVTTGISGQATIGRAGFELGPVDPIACQALQDADSVRTSIGVKVESDPQASIQLTAGAGPPDVQGRGSRPLLARAPTTTSSHAPDAGCCTFASTAPPNAPQEEPLARTPQAWGRDRAKVPR